ncbi:MAG: hypothetical protein CUN55_04825 [Phototrophicales bacterium]|nr:MAG: hypothetical protein CUN55_04825 [Phototrophicales bacterium]
MRSLTRWLLLLIVLISAACSTSTNDPELNPDGPRLVGENAMPKRIVTVVFTNTPSGEITNTPMPTFDFPTDFPQFEEPTFTPTPIVGVFIGTAVNGTPESAAIAPVAVDNATGLTSSSSVNVPIASVPAVTSGGNCQIPVADTFRDVLTRNSAALQPLGCPVDGGQAINLVYQPFERGKMFWRNTRQIYIFQPNNLLLILPDTWQEGMPASDDAYAPPSPNLLQPVRGFGFVWRSNETIRNTLGWATQGESPIPSFWQSFENGALFVGEGGAIYAIILSTSTYLGPL